MMRIRAFTLLELVLALALSAIVLNSMYLAARIISRQQLTLMRKWEAAARLQTLQALLSRDFHWARSVQSSETGLLCRRGNQVIEYEWLDSCVIRRQPTLVDSFHVRILSRQHFFHDRPQQETNALVEKVELTVELQQDTVLLTAATWYDAMQLLNVENKN